VYPREVYAQVSCSLNCICFTILGRVFKDKQKLTWPLRQQETKESFLTLTSAITKDEQAKKLINWPS